jgi:uncharacterized protein YggU (UPF0235/DUF167 family)
MARVKADLPPREALRALLDADGRLALRVTPGAKVEGLEIAEGCLLAKVRARPEDGKANAALRDLLARAFVVAPSHITLLRGATAREKQFVIEE